jgi:hypothetical protein
MFSNRSTALQQLSRPLVLSALVIAASWVATRSLAEDVARVKVTPNGAKLALSGSQQFTAEVYGRGDERLRSTVTWSVRPEWIGRITQDGLFTAGNKVGDGLVRAEVEVRGQRVASFAFVRVGTGGGTQTPVHVSVTPGRAHLTPGEGTTFTASVAGSTSTTPEWRVVPESFGRIDATGHFTAGVVPSEGRVVAIIRSPAGSVQGFGQAAVSISEHRSGSPQVAGRLRLMPGHVTLHPGESRAIRAQSISATAAHLPPVLWSVEPSDLGTMSADGVFTAGAAPGAGIVRGTVTLSDGHVLNGATAIRITESSEGSQLRIIPQNPIVPRGKSVRFSVKRASDRSGSYPDIHVEWRLTPDNLGHITPDGQFTAGSEALNGQVVAEVRNSRGQLLASVSTNVTVGSGDLPMELQLSPPGPVSLYGGQVREVTLTLGGRPLPPAVDVRWTTGSEGVVRLLMTQGSTVRFQAIHPGTATLTARVRFRGRTTLSPSLAVIVTGQ